MEFLDRGIEVERTQNLSYFPLDIKGLSTLSETCKGHDHLAYKK